MTATFMPSLGPDYPGLGGHVTLSLIDKATGRNLFADPAGETNALARNFIGGMTQIVPEVVPGFAPHCQRLSPLRAGDLGAEIGQWSDWCFTTAVRSCPSAGDTARLEFRLPGTDCNTHLTLALTLGAGLDGIARGLQAPDPSPNSGPDDIVGARLPGTLPEAAARLAASDHARRLFGGAFIDNFTAFCAAETASLAREVSDAERRRYLEG